MKSVVVTRHGGPEVLAVVEEPVPEPGPGAVRIQVAAAGVSAHDGMLRRSGRLPGTPKVPFNPGLDVVGPVDAVGEGVTGVTAGQVVAAGLYTLGYGGYTERICVPADAVVPVPEGVDPAQAVCLVVNYLTAHTMLHHGAKVQRGERVLIHGAAGGVGSAMVELGRLAGLEMFGTASARHHGMVERLGATPIDYRTEDFVARVLELTGDGVDAVFDPIGGARQLRRSYQCLRRGGRLIWYGVAAEKRQGLKVIAGSLLMRTLLALRPDGRSAPMPPDAGDFAAETLPALMGLLAAGKLAPVVAARLPLAEARRAHEMLEAGGVEGKIVLITKD
ncbi:MAG: zinc-binding dehydrogenase [Alphaproteobacteria bacterium]|nr:zinc-binding dehydrogenase [Alphaproteobacteria bacterium]